MKAQGQKETSAEHRPVIGIGLSLDQDFASNNKTKTINLNILITLLFYY